jgi:acyl-CoA reductase-like NAD-dependent aldehyde dehydrogenase
MERELLIDVDPTTGETIAEVPCATAAEVLAAVERARAARAAWAAVPLDARSAALASAAERLAERAEELADLITREMGKPRAEALAEVRGGAKGVAQTLEEVARALEPERIQGQGVETVILREPLGVVAAITPWNYPVGMPLSILIPALATGNTVVFKPSELVPLVGAALAELLGTYLPEGVLQCLQGGGDVGRRLTQAPVDMIGFVGSRATGAAIMAAAAPQLKRLVLELGGKDPLLVFADADLELAAECAVRHSLRNAGQVCCSVERIYVAEAVAERFEASVLAKAREWRPGNGFVAGTRLGPLASAQQRQRVAQQIDEAVARGARLLLGGRVLPGPGFYFAPTVITAVPADASLATEETFGPVIHLERFDGSEARAIELANAGVYGLGANVYTGDVERGLRVARAIHSGQVGVNRYLTAAGPWVGARQSGFGFLGGVDGHRQFTCPKSISLQQG